MSGATSVTDSFHHRRWSRCSVWPLNYPSWSQHTNASGPLLPSRSAMLCWPCSRLWPSCVCQPLNDDSHQCNFSAWRKNQWADFTKCMPLSFKIFYKKQELFFPSCLKFARVFLALTLTLFLSSFLIYLRGWDASSPSASMHAREPHLVQSVIVVQVETVDFWVVGPIDAVQCQKRIVIMKRNRVCENLL